MGHLDVHLARRLFSRASIVLDHMVSLSGTALDRRASSGILLRALAKIDAAALAAADLVVVDTDRHLDALPEASRTKAVVVPVGAPHAWFREPVRRDRGELSVVFFGLYTPLQGAETIGRAIAILGERQGAVAVTMIGTGQDYDAARAAAGSASGVAWIDWVASERLPDVVAAHDVCLGIFGTGDKAHRVVPNKVFQGAAAGCAIVTSDTAPQRDILGRDAILVPPGDPDALASALLELSRDADLLWRLRSAAYRRASRSFRPEVVVQPLRARLGNVTMPP